MEYVILVKPKFKPKMDYEQFFPKQTVQECEREKFVAGLLAILTTVYLLFDCMYMCTASRKMKALRDENETLKSIVLKSMERGLLRMMHQQTEDEHED